jgi:hypothetical protein
MLDTSAGHVIQRYPDGCRELLRYVDGRDIHVREQPPAKPFNGTLRNEKGDIPALVPEETQFDPSNRNKKQCNTPSETPEDIREFY